MKEKMDNMEFENEIRTDQLKSLRNKIAIAKG